MNFRILLTAAISLLIHGCATNTSCVAVSNPNETILAGKVTAKERITDKVIIGSPRSVHVTDRPPEGADAAMGARFLSAIVIAGVVSGGNPALAGAIGSQVMNDGALYSGQTLPANLEAEVGEPCQNDEQVLEHGATRYSVRSGENAYYVHSAYSGFSLGECVNVFVSNHGGALQARIAPGGSCTE